MYAREQRVLLRHYLEQGLSKAEIARKLRVSRRTLYHWIESGQLDRELETARCVRAEAAGGAQDRSVPADDPGSTGRVSAAQRDPALGGSRAAATPAVTPS